ncbi:MAG: DUF309 domain-containing protein [Aeromicrobium sp.]
MATDRDRDEEGRARNARPRDGLGRPLPYGSAGVERQPEGIERTPDETIRDAQRLLDEGMPFHAHEVFEDAWKTGPAEGQSLWKGLAQLAVGLTHAARGNSAGAATLLRRGVDNIEVFADAVPHGIDIVGLCSWGRGLADEVEGGSAAADPAALAPRLRAG